MIAKLKVMLDTMDRMDASLDSLANSFSKETVDALPLIHEADPRVHDTPILVEVETPHPSPTSIPHFPIDESCSLSDDEVDEEIVVESPSILESNVVLPSDFPSCDLDTHIVCEDSTPLHAPLHETRHDIVDDVSVDISNPICECDELSMCVVCYAWRRYKSVGSNSLSANGGTKDNVNPKPKKDACFHEFDVPLLEDSLIMSNSLIDDALTLDKHIPIDSLELDTLPYHDHMFLHDVKHVPTPSLPNHTCALTHEFLEFVDDDVSSHLVVDMESKETLELVTTNGNDVVLSDAPMDEVDNRVALNDEKHPNSQGFYEELLLDQDGLKGSSSLSQVSGSSNPKGKQVDASILLHLNEGFMTMKVDDQLFKFNVYEAMKHPFERYSLLGLNFIDGLMDEWVSQHVRALSMHGNNLVPSRLPILDSCSFVYDNVCMIDHLDESVKLESMSRDFPKHTFHDCVDANPNHLPIPCHDTTISMPYLHVYNPLHKGSLFHVVGTFRMHKEYWEFIKAARELTRKLQATCDAFGKSIMKKLPIGRIHQIHGHKFLFFKDNFKPP